jgi:hypothetical protein
MAERKHKNENSKMIKPNENPALNKIAQEERRKAVGEKKKKK